MPRSRSNWSHVAASASERRAPVNSRNRMALPLVRSGWVASAVRQPDHFLRTQIAFPLLLAIPAYARAPGCRPPPPADREVQRLPEHLDYPVGANRLVALMFVVQPIDLGITELRDLLPTEFRQNVGAATCFGRRRPHRFAFPGRCFALVSLGEVGDGRCLPWRQRRPKFGPEASSSGSIPRSILRSGRGLLRGRPWSTRLEATDRQSAFPAVDDVVQDEGSRCHGRDADAEAGQVAVVHDPGSVGRGIPRL